MEANKKVLQLNVHSKVIKYPFPSLSINEEEMEQKCSYKQRCKNGEV